METKPLLYGIIGFLLGGLVVSFAATYLDDRTAPAGEMPTSHVKNER